MNIQQYGSTDLTLLTAHFGVSLLHNCTPFQSQGHEQRHVMVVSCSGCSIWNCKKPLLFSGHYLRNRSTLDIGVLGYIGIL
jgi:hypothetical protein